MNWILISINSWSGSKFLSVLEYIVAKMTAQKFEIDYTPIREEEPAIQPPVINTTTV